MIINRLKKREEKDKDKFRKEVECITVGTIAGIITYVFCLIIHLDIFGWNLGLAFSPLVAGYVETYFAKKYLNETTGAVSAYVLFIITVIYGFILSNSTLGFNIITVGSIIIILQAAIPTAINYFLIAMFIGIISHSLGIFKKITDVVYGKYLIINKRLNKEHYFRRDEIVPEQFLLNKEDEDIDNIGILFLTTSRPPTNKEILEYKGIYEGRIVVEYDQIEGIKKKELRNEDLLSILRHAKNQAYVNLANSLKKDGCNGIININMIYETLGTSGADNILQIVISGTGVVFDEKA